MKTLPILILTAFIAHASDDPKPLRTVLWGRDNRTNRIDLMIDLTYRVTTYDCRVLQYDRDQFKRYTNSLVVAGWTNLTAKAKADAAKAEADKKADELAAAKLQKQIEYENLKNALAQQKAAVQRLRDAATIKFDRKIEPLKREYAFHELLFQQIEREETTLLRVDVTEIGAAEKLNALRAKKELLIERVSDLRKRLDAARADFELELQAIDEAAKRTPAK